MLSTINEHWATMEEEKAIDVSISEGDPSDLTKF